MNRQMVDKEGIRAGYEEVRDNATETIWIQIGYNEENALTVLSSGKVFSDLHELCTPDQRCFFFLRMETGDEMSRRTKFVFVMFAGVGLTPMRRCGLATAKATVKEIIQNFAVEVQWSEPGDCNDESLLDELNRAGGANYGTGARSH